MKVAGLHQDMYAPAVLHRDLKSGPCCCICGCATFSGLDFTCVMKGGANHSHSLHEEYTEGLRNEDQLKA